MMSGSACRIVSGLLLILSLFGCQSGEEAGTAESNCRGFLKIYDDLKAGNIGSDPELKERLDEDIGSFKEGSDLRQTFDSLLAAIESVDESRANAETSRLVDQCSEFAD
jgi:hypothetical protein